MSVLLPCAASVLIDEINTRWTASACIVVLCELLAPGHCIALLVNGLRSSPATIIPRIEVSKTLNVVIVDVHDLGVGVSVATRTPSPRAEDCCPAGLARNQTAKNLAGSALVEQIFQIGLILSSAGCPGIRAENIQPDEIATPCTTRARLKCAQKVR